MPSDGEIITGSLSRRRSVNFAPLYIPDVHSREIQSQSLFMTTPGERLPVNEVVEQGVELFRNFIYEEFRHDDLDTKPLDMAFPEPVRPLLNHQWPTIAARELREMANRFRRSEERQRVRDQANQVPIEQVDHSHFICLLRELFESEGDVTSDRIVVLFCFCCDLIKRCVHMLCNNLCRQLLTWSLEFLRNSVCAWVLRHGGWISVFNRSMEIYKKITVMVMCSALLCGAFLFFKRRL